MKARLFCKTILKGGLNLHHYNRSEALRVHQVFQTKLGRWRMISFSAKLSYSIAKLATHHTRLPCPSVQTFYMPGEIYKLRSRLVKASCNSDGVIELCRPLAFVKTSDVFTALRNSCATATASVEVIPVEVDGTHLHTFSRCVTLNAEVAFVVSFAAKKGGNEAKTQNTTREQTKRAATTGRQRHISGPT